MTTLPKIQENSFSEACYNQNSIDELIDALAAAADKTDMKTWGIKTVREYKQQIAIALKNLIADLPDLK